MEFERIRLMEHLAVRCPLSLEELCDAMRLRLGLPSFRFDSENETEWGCAEQEGIEYNVSRPYEPGTLQEWDSSVPEGCNFGISLIVSRDNPPSQNAEWSAAEFAAHIGQELADLLGQPVYHHRTWAPAGNVSRTHVSRPTGS